jgi:gliding motility-associated-like protein
VEPDTATINEGDGQQLGIAVYGSGVGDFQYTWTPTYGLRCTDCPDPVAAPTSTTEYSVVVTSDSGCVATSSATITVNPQHEIYVPNAFSPNNDGINDYWEIFGYKKAWVFVKVEVFDRWGEKVFESTDVDFQWDGTYRGTPVSIGVYVYSLTVTFIDGYSDHSKGTITIIK